MFVKRSFKNSRNAINKSFVENLNNSSFAVNTQQNNILKTQGSQLGDNNKSLTREHLSQFERDF